MNKYRLGNYGTIMKGNEDFCQYDEPYSLIAELNDLEAQLKEANDKNKWIKKQQESWNSTTKETIKDLERKLADEKAKSKALLVGLEVQNLDDFINRADVENYKKLGENITIGFKTQLKEQGEDETKPRN